MANGTIAPFPKHQLFTNAGVIASGYQLFTYEAGTTTKLATYNDSDLDVSHQNANPIVLDSAGRATIFLTAASYKFVLASPTDTDPPASPIWTVDDVAASALFNASLAVTGTAGETITANQVVYLSDGTGGTTAGRWYLGDSDAAASSVLATTIGLASENISTGNSGSIHLYGRFTGLSGLTIGANQYIGSTAGSLTESAPEFDKIVGRADSATSMVLTQAPIIPATTNRSGSMTQSDQAFSGQKLFGLGTSASSGGAIRFEIAPSSANYAYTMGLDATNSETTVKKNVSTGETDLASKTLPANTLNVTGRCLHIFGSFTPVNNANAKTLQFYWNGSSIVTHTMNASTANPVWCDVKVWRTGSNTQGIAVRFENQDDAGNNNITVGATTGSATESGAIAWKFTGTGGASDDIVENGVLAWIS